MWWLQVLRTNPVMEAFGNASRLDFGLAGAMDGHVFCQVFSKVAWGCRRFENEPLYTWVLPEAIRNLLRILIWSRFEFQTCFFSKVMARGFGVYNRILIVDKDCFTPPKMCLRMHCGCHRYHQHASIIITEKHPSSIQGHDRAQQQLLEADGCFFCCCWNSSPFSPWPSRCVIFICQKV